MRERSGTHTPFVSIDAPVSSSIWNRQLKLAQAEA
jgi:hypothetical protein